MPIEKLRELQNARLSTLVQRLYQTVPFYKKQFDEIGLLPGDIKTVADLSKVPFTKKTDLRDNYPFGLFAKP
ncbi:MAG: phenylacetate--CoA ligase, partial [Bacteroidota bacterium]